MHWSRFPGPLLSLRQTRRPAETVSVSIDRLSGMLRQTLSYKEDLHAIGPSVALSDEVGCW